MRQALLLLTLFIASGCAAGAQASPTVSPTPTPHPRVLGKADLKRALDSASQASFKITYSLNGKVNGAAYSGRLIIYQRPPLKRVEIYDGVTTLNVYFTGGDAYVCAVPLQLPCRAMSVDQARALTGAGIDDLLRVNVALFETAELTDDRIAGQDSTCFKARPDDAGKLSPGARQILACYTSEGLPTRIELLSEGNSLMLEGILVLRDFPESDAQPPAGATPSP